MTTKKTKKKKAQTVDRPFAPQILADAERIAVQYQIVLWREDGQWYGRGVELPNVYGDGSTPAKCVADTLAVLTTTVATLLEDGDSPPPPAREGTEPSRST